MGDLGEQVVVRPMEPGEFEPMRTVSIEAFGDDEHIGLLLDALRASGRGATS